MLWRWLPVALGVVLAGCAGDGGSVPSDADTSDTASSSGRYAMSGDAYPQEPPDVSRVPDAVPRKEPLSRGGNRSTYEVWGKTYHVLPDASGYVKQGTASWYGEKFHGYATSNGEIYDMYKMSAAHRSLPLPSFARVTNRDNGRSAIVRVNDRGPFHSEREIDLSYAAAARLDILDNGTGRVTVEAIDVDRWLAENGEGGAGTKRAADTARQGVVPAATATATQAPATQSRRPEDNAVKPPLYLQVAALSSAHGARDLRTRLESDLSRPVRVAEAAGTHRVQVGPISRLDQVEPLREALRRAGFAESFIVK
ncbi:septal ring lytic transglycosylase RlpA family protein [Halomonas halodenitrificans]|uniref:septal ring lytic transglycosylase RlpA family protein n=1 Tax=Halomonas halodenitrificans TaxID=28252 RepID=UPI0004811FFE|nr:septal ring lytic transglycosylase RlpA family protein [Halomonas halodenitrificans]